MTSRVPGIVSIVFLVASAAFIMLNLVVDRSSFWAVWVIWAMSMLGGGVIGMFRLTPHRLLGLWLGAGIPLQLGLFLIDIGDINPWWFFWPLGAWVVGAMAIAGLTVNLLDSVPTSSPFIDVGGEPSRSGVAPATSAATELAGMSRQPVD
jgi:hypothetical protein